MYTFEEIIEEQERIERVFALLSEILGEPVSDFQKLFILAEKLKKNEYFLIYVLHVGLWDGKRWKYAEIARFLGKKRAVIRKKFLIASRILEERACTSTNSSI